MSPGSSIEGLVAGTALDPSVSVVIPAWNAAPTVASAVNSALAQGPGVEVIVVDDGSTDATAAAVGALASSAVRVTSRPHGGLPAARNAGVALARAPLVAFLDSDDLMLPGWLGLATEALASNAHAAFAYTDAHVFDAQAGRFRRRSAMARSHPPLPSPADPNAFLHELLERNFVFSAAVVRAEVLHEVGGFDETFGSAEDYHLWLRILLAGHVGTVVPGRHAIYRKHPLQMSRQLTTMSDALRDVYRSLPLEELPTAAHRQLLLRRRSATTREARLMRIAAPLLPLRVVERAKRLGVGEAWFEDLPPDVDPAIRELLTEAARPS